MTRDEAVSDIKVALGRFNSTVLDTEIVTHLQRAQTRLEKSAPRWLNSHYPWFLVKDLASLNTVKDDDKVSPPAGFLAEVEEGGLFRLVDGKEYKKLIKEDWNVIRVKFSDPGTPVWYALIGKVFRLAPTPDAVYPLRLLYYGTDTVLTSNIENDWLAEAPDILVGEAGIRVANSVRNNDAMQYFGGLKQQGELDLEAVNESRLHSNRDYQMLFDGRLREGE